MHGDNRIESTPFAKPLSWLWYVLMASFVIGLSATLWLAFTDFRLVRALRSTASMAKQVAAIPHTAAAPVTSTPRDYVSVLPVVADVDSTIRSVTRLASHQDVIVSQMHGELIGNSADRERLGQVKFTLQLQGDYRNIKMVVSGLLSKFPGLTLQRMTIRHREAPGGNSATEGNEDASLELIQFLRPADYR